MRYLNLIDASEKIFQELVSNEKEPTIDNILKRLTGVAFKHYSLCYRNELTKLHGQTEDIHIRQQLSKLISDNEKEIKNRGLEDVTQLTIFRS